MTKNYSASSCQKNKLETLLLSPIITTYHKIPEKSSTFLYSPRIYLLLDAVSSILSYEEHSVPNPSLIMKTTRSCRLFSSTSPGMVPIASLPWGHQLVLECRESSPIRYPVALHTPYMRGDTQQVMHCAGRLPPSE